MKLLILLFSILTISVSAHAQLFSRQEKESLDYKAKQITIIKDKWGVPHVYTKTDEHAVFGMMYVQCEEFFEKVENTLISRLGRQAEVDGEGAIYKDLWARMYTDSTKAKELFLQSPKWLQKLCVGFADGINYYMITHPEKKPKLITRAEPWMCLMNNIPSLGGSNIDEKDFIAFYSKKQEKFTSSLEREENEFWQEPAGSNGWALAPSRTKNKKAMLLINPHSEFYGRIEIQLVSKEGLNSYGAPFLGQFNIFQGFNDKLGWMHPISLSDAKDLYQEAITQKEGRYHYLYNDVLKPVDSTEILLKYKSGNEVLDKKIMTYRTHHGPVVSGNDGQWITLKTISSNIDLLAMHWEKMKAKNLGQFKEVLNRRVMTGSNVIYADRKGNIAYWHGNFVPVKKTDLDWKRPVDGSTEVTEWKGTYQLDEIPHYINPTNGWLQNCNSTILYGTGKFDTIMSKKPAFMFPDAQTPRAVGAIRVLENLKDASIDDVVAAAHDTYLPNAAKLIPNLISAYEKLENSHDDNTLKEPIEILKNWDFHTNTSSVPTTLAVLWIEKIIEKNVAALTKPLTNEERYSVTNGGTVNTEALSSEEILEAFRTIVLDLNKDFGTWKVAWGDINRFQRNPDQKQPSDQEPSWAVPATPGYLGSLNAYVSRKAPGTKKRYGATGNTFVAVVEFGKKPKAKTILTGGASSNSASQHFTDQVEGYINHQYKEIFFAKKDVLKNAERIYHPGEKSQ